MNHTTTALLPAMALCVSLLAGAAVPAFAQSSPGAPAARQELTLVQIHDKLMALGYHNIRGIEREHGVFEATVSDKTGARVKLHLDAVTGETVNNRRDMHGRGRHEGGSHGRRGRDGGHHEGHAHHRQERSHSESR